MKAEDWPKIETRGKQKQKQHKVWNIKFCPTLNGVLGIKLKKWIESYLPTAEQQMRKGLDNLLVLFYP